MDTPLPSAPHDPLDLAQYAPASATRDAPPPPPAAALCAPLPACFVVGRTIQAALLGLLVVPIPFLGERVRRNEIAIAVSRDGEARLLEPGVNVTETLNADVRRFAASEDEVAHGNLKIVRVRPGHVGLASRAGQPVLLEPGVHISNDPLWLWRRQVANDCPHASEGALHVWHVPAGSLGLATEGGAARLIGAGEAVYVDCPSF